MITIVSGVPRSGTSVMMQMLVAGGLAPLTDGARSADDNNPRGYFEWEKAKTLPRQPASIAEAEGKVVKIISALLPSLLGQFAYKVIFMERPLAEVVASQAAMVQKLEAQGASLSQEAMARALEAHIKQVKAHLRQRPEIVVHEVSYHAVLANAQAAAEEIRQFLDVPLDVAAMVSQLHPDLYRQRHLQQAGWSSAAKPQS